MLSRHPFIQKKQKHGLCNCSLIQPSVLYTEPETFQVANQREISQLDSLMRRSGRFNPKSSCNRQKTSLRGSRIGKEKENPKESVPAEANQMPSPMKQSTLCPSQPFSQDNKDHQRRKRIATTCKTSIFKRTTLPVDGRKRKEEEEQQQQYENTKTNKQRDRYDLPRQRQTCYNHPFGETLKLSQISNETQYDYLRLHKNLQTKDQLTPQQLTQYHSQHADIASQNALSQYSQQSPVMRNKRKKTTKIYHRIQLLQFKSTESIDDDNSVGVSEVISDILDSQSYDNLSEQRLPTTKRLTFLLKTRFSRTGDRQQ